MLQNWTCHFSCDCTCHNNPPTTYLCPISWAMMKAEARPMSSLMLQLRPLSHIPSTGASPSHIQITLSTAVQSSFRCLQLTNSTYKVADMFKTVKFHWTGTVQYANTHTYTLYSMQSNTHTHSHLFLAILPLRDAITIYLSRLVECVLKLLLQKDSLSSLLSLLSFSTLSRTKSLPLARSLAQ